LTIPGDYLIGKDFIEIVKRKTTVVDPPGFVRYWGSTTISGPVISIDRLLPKKQGRIFLPFIPLSIL